MKNGSQVLVPTQTFTSLSAADTYFTDDPLALGTINGNARLTLTYTLTETGTGGVAISYLVAYTSTPSASPTGTPALEGPSRIARIGATDLRERFFIAGDHGPAVAAVLADFNAHYAAMNRAPAEASPRVAERVGEERLRELIKHDHR